MEEKVLLERHKNTDYTVWYNQNRYYWSPAKRNISSKLPVPREVYDYLAMSTNCLRNGELVIAQSVPSELKEELVEEIYEKEEHEANALTRDQIEKILKGTIPAMKAELEKITSITTKRFVLEVAKEIKLSNSNKQMYIKEWYGSELPIETLFGLETEEE